MHFNGLTRFAVSSELFEDLPADQLSNQTGAFPTVSSLYAQLCNGKCPIEQVHRSKIIFASLVRENKSVTEFENFLEKTERILVARKAAMAATAAPVSDPKLKRDDPDKLRRLSSLEWSKLLLSVTDQTNGKTINKDRFLAYGRTGVMLGKIMLVLKPSRDQRKDKLRYFAEYRSSSSDGGVVRLAEVSIEPKISRTYSGEEEISWLTVGLGDCGRLATGELAMILAMKLVDVYQANET